ncbi:ArsB/NhaD family transporter [Bacillus tianshenii]|nr:ArsB/NhaD family transporter [Bacillus tianshenii]
MDMVMSLVIFGSCYVMLVLEKWNRALIAGAGGLLMILGGIYTLDDAFGKYIDWNTISLLFSMMILVAVTSKTGVFEYIAITLAQKVGGRAIPLLVVMALLTAVGSALLDNVTTVLLFAPVLLTMTARLGLPSTPYLIVLILASNIGGTATLIGDPPNIMIGQAVEDLTFNDFLLNLGPIVVIIFGSVMLALIGFYRKQLKVTEAKRIELMNIQAAEYLRKDMTLFQSLFVLCCTIAGFVLHPVLHIELTSIAMAGALLLMLLTYRNIEVEDILRDVEWVTLFFFMGLFMLVGGLESTGIIDEIARSIILQTEGDVAKTSLFILWSSGLLSGFVDNIPFVAAMIPVVLEFKDYGMNNLDPLWWALALGACLGGNATLIGASANVVVAGLAAGAKQPIKFVEFFVIGLPVVIFSLILSTVYLYIRYLIYFI